jgi:hypothetical protein
VRRCPSRARRRQSDWRTYSSAQALFPAKQVGANAVTSHGKGSLFGGKVAYPTLLELVAEIKVLNAAPEDTRGAAHPIHT